VAVFPVLVFAFIRLNRQYGREAAAVEALEDTSQPDPPNYPRRAVLVLVDDLDLAAIAALRYARSLRPTMLRAVHFVLDQQRAGHLHEQWLRAHRDIPLDLVDCPDRRIDRAAGELAARQAAQPGTHVTVVLPRRSTAPLLGRLLHDRTADKIARLVSRIPGSAATIIPFDVSARIGKGERQAGTAPAAAPADLAAHGLHGVTPASHVAPRRRVTVDGRVHTVEIRQARDSCILACTITDASGQVTALLCGRSQIPGLTPGRCVRLRGTVSAGQDGAVLINPAYELLG